MTCIAAYKEDGKVYIGGDSIATDVSHKFTIGNPKVFKKGKFLFGYTGSFRMGQLIEFSLKIPRKSGSSDYEYMVTSFVPALRECFKENGWIYSDNNVEYGGEFIVGYNSNIYQIQNDFSVMQSSDNYFSVGCGSAFALGAFAALENSPISPREKVEQALRAAIKHDPCVAGPIVVICG